MSRTFTIRSLGCKVSQYDGDRLAAMLERFGLRPAGDRPPDLFVLNSCSVTGRASQKSRQALRAARKAWPAARIVLAGCETALCEKTGDGSVAIDGLLPLHPTPDMVEGLLGQLGLLEPAAHRVTPPVAPGSERPETGRGPEEVGAEADQAHGEAAGRSRTRAFLKVQDGCNQFCSYCIVPHLRGRERSRPVAEVLAEARDLVERGFREIVLTGIHLGRFEPGLVPLLRDLERLEGLARIRLSSIEPLEVTDELIAWLASSPAACAHLHLPLQAGTDPILRAMNRPYTVAQFAEVVARVRARLPRIGLTTDLIVGFPGESEALFREGLAFVERMAFSRIHIFRFSARPGTPAATMVGQVGNAEKQARAKAAEQVWHASAAAYHRSFVGQEVEVLWETCADSRWHGHSREYIPCTCVDSGSGLADNVIRRHRAVAATADGLVVGGVGLVG
ncbi:MAG: tRNA-t(6)A37 methylthiotransferase [Candidatus Ozemobacter sibiricus]|jgi:threonylcarbamoyladenosine tRNA methylthiotransferase MtaB|uniref:tRNA-t(6)A37 methylthiotransferase n=1 Tax=Candidatus Ozemobacter sibiricus TaxID=2268124 RepID=A0A367ZPQ7_9BACT|nr:MAG: tRNA-t(6)A37 methylthiotransferase [Candidatus Ozemobacter sibiricus]